MKIGLFDSGLGGLTILRAVAASLPQYDYVYYGDTANLPYGDKSEEHIYTLSVAAMDYLFGQGCVLVVVACNTASAETLRRLQLEYLPTRPAGQKILGVIIPTIETLLEIKAANVLLLATTRTVSSRKYERELEKRESTVRLATIAVPTLVPLIEAGDIEAAVQVCISVIDTQRAQAQGVDAVVLGCTHYTVFKEALRTHYGTALQVISQDEIIPDKLKAYLEAHPELGGGVGDGGRGERLVHLTADRPDYDHIIGQLLGGVFVGE